MFEKHDLNHFYTYCFFLLLLSTIKDMAKKLAASALERSELVEQTFNFWYNSADSHIRSPFPDYIRADLKRLATQSFNDWINALSSGADKELNDEMIGEKFEEIIFEEGLKLVLTEDEKVSINYPFLPRLGDEINADDGEISSVTDRYIHKEGDHVFLLVVLEKSNTKERWETQFELPK